MNIFQHVFRAFKGCAPWPHCPRCSSLGPGIRQLGLGRRDEAAWKHLDALDTVRPPLKRQEAGGSPRASQMILAKPPAGFPPSIHRQDSECSMMRRLSGPGCPGGLHSHRWLKCAMCPPPALCPASSPHVMEEAQSTGEDGRNVFPFYSYAVLTSLVQT